MENKKFCICCEKELKMFFGGRKYCTNCSSFHHQKNIIKCQEKIKWKTELKESLMNYLKTL